jgi:hypothetical protein
MPANYGNAVIGKVAILYVFPLRVSNDGPVPFFIGRERAARVLHIFIKNGYYMLCYDHALNIPCVK